MQRYGGLLVNLKYFFLHYVMMSDPSAFIAVISGIVVTVLFLMLLFIRSNLKYPDTLVFLALLPLCIGAVGTIYTVHNTREAVKIENENGKSSSAEKYYDLEYIYSRTLIQSFPVLAGAASTIIPIVLLVALKRRVIRKNE